MMAAWLVSTVGMVVFGAAWLVALRALFTAEEERDDLWDDLTDLWDQLPPDAKAAMMTRDPQRYFRNARAVRHSRI